VKRLERMILAAHPDSGPKTPGRIIPLARYLRPAAHYALTRNPQPKGDPHDHGSDLA
jgi:hypothetical protein